ncbi:MAG: EamA family transporter RarD [Gemmatimonadetes bacterium]|nr:MAG: EamA family transporter RarD [Gemmatimonadota bacterium]
MLSALIAYILWGLLPVYWKWLSHIPAYEIFLHRTVWSLGFVVVLLAWQRHWHGLKQALHRPGVLFSVLASSLLLATNWLTYIWGVTSGNIVETSLGYFINPLVNVLFGMLFLREQLRWMQGVAVLIAAAGVFYLTFNYGRFPWIALTLAFSFALYSLLRKTMPLSSLEGLSIETAILFLPALGTLIAFEFKGLGAFGHTDIRTTLLLIFTGVATASPLLFFARGAKSITLTTLGLLQYLAPTIQFGLGVFVYHEAFNTTRLIGFSLIWFALVIYSGESIWSYHRQRNGNRPGSTSRLPVS